MEIKICGIKTFEDAEMCLHLGAHTLGFLIGQEHASDDFISLDTARTIIERLKPNKFYATLVTHLTDELEIIGMIKKGGFNSVQLHSNIIDKQVEKIKKELPKTRIVRLIHVSKTGEIAPNLDELKIADLYLLDSFNLQTNQVGGTGTVHNWQASAKLAEELSKPVFLAGGLNPKNIQQAIKTVKPFGIDVNSGVKNPKGFKDEEKVKNFIENATSDV